MAAARSKRRPAQVPSSRPRPRRERPVQSPWPACSCRPGELSLTGSCQIRGRCANSREQNQDRDPPPSDSPTHCSRLNPLPPPIIHDYPRCRTATWSLPGPEFAAREVSRPKGGRRRAPRERSAERATRRAVEAASGRAARRRRSRVARGARSDVEARAAGAQRRRGITPRGVDPAERAERRYLALLLGKRTLSGAAFRRWRRSFVSSVFTRPACLGRTR